MQGTFPPVVPRHHFCVERAHWPFLVLAHIAVGAQQNLLGVCFADVCVDCFTAALELAICLRTHLRRSAHHGEVACLLLDSIGTDE